MKLQWLSRMAARPDALSATRKASKRYPVQGATVT